MTIKFDIERYVAESNKIEGVNDPQEVAQSLKAWDFLKDHKMLDLSVIQETHRVIMQNLAPEFAGKLRTVDVRVGVHPITPHQMIRQRLSHWLLDMHNAVRPDCQDLWQCQPRQMHIRFEQIHPFRDGNGRVGRMLMWWHELRLGQKPTLIKYDERYDYYSWWV